MAKSTDWIIAVPVHNLVISHDIGGTMKLERVTFVSSKKIPYIRRELKLPFRISEYGKPPKHLGKYFGETKTYAFIITCGRSTPDFLEEHALIKRAIWILRSSQFLTCGRTNDKLFGSYEFGSSSFSTEYFFPCGGDKMVRTSSSRMTPIQEYRLDKRWRSKEMKYHFFNHLLKVVAKKTKAENSWRITIINAAVLAAKSHYSSELSEAFLYNIIALESLISIGDSEQRISLEMYNHIYFFFGWMSKHSDRDELKTRIKRLYQLRSGFVHSGTYDQIKINDLLVLDELLGNLLFNICRHISVFSEQKKILEFSEQIKAQEILGMQPSRPQKFIYLSRSSTDSRKAIAKIRKVKRW